MNEDNFEGLLDSEEISVNSPSVSLVNITVMLFQVLNWQNFQMWKLGKLACWIR